jgi:hypothetical protein
MVEDNATQFREVIESALDSKGTVDPSWINATPVQGRSGATVLRHRPDADEDSGTTRPMMLSSGAGDTSREDGEAQGRSELPLPPGESSLVSRPHRRWMSQAGCGALSLFE